MEYVRNAGRCILLILVAIAPWAYAMAQWKSQLAFCYVAIALLALAVASEKCVVPRGILHRCFLVVLIFVFIQTIPLPQSISNWVSGNASFNARTQLLADEFSEKWRDGPDLGLETKIEKLEFPTSISIAPEQTRTSLAVLGAAACLLWAASLLFADMRWQLVLLAILAISGAMNAGLGIVQNLSGEWTLLQDLHGGSFSTFVNRNSAPQYYAIAMGATFALIVWWFNSKGSSLAKKYGVHYPAVNIMARLRRRIESLVSELDFGLVMLLIGLVVLFAAVFASASRGGILACAIANVILTVRFLADYRASFLGLLLLVGGLVAVLLLSALGIAGETSERLNTLSEELHQLSNVRLELWQHVLWHKECWLFGSGYGTFHLSVLDNDLPLRSTWYYHAENIYVEILATLGIAALLLIGSCFGFFIYETMKESQNKNYLSIAILPAICAIATQSMVDFSLILPGIFIPFLVLAGCVCHEGKSTFAWSQVSVKEGWLSVIVAVLATAYGLPSLHDASVAESLAIAQGKSISSTAEFEVARQEQLEFKAFVTQSVDWPDEIDDDMRAYISRPEIFAVALTFQGNQIPQLEALAESQPESLEFLRSTGVPMANTIESSPLDWRASWGLLRADYNLVSRDERLRNLARLYQTAGHKPGLLADVGSYLFWSKNKELGIEFWRKAIRKDDRYIQNAVRLVPIAMDGSDLIQVLPNKPFLQINAALQLKGAGHIEESFKMVEVIEIDKAKSLAVSSDQWRKIAIIADLQGAVEEAADAAVKAASKTAGNEQLRFEAAKALLKASRLEEALKEITRALQDSPNRPAFRALEDSIRQQIDTLKE
ncbi:MAG: O-antigen ligase family protein [Planctomycetota bacterium]